MQVLLQRIGTTSDATEKDSLALHFLKKVLPNIFFKI